MNSVMLCKVPQHTSRLKSSWHTLQPITVQLNYLLQLPWNIQHRFG